MNFGIFSCQREYFHKKIQTLFYFTANNYVRCNLSSSSPEFTKCAKTPLTILTSFIINGSKQNIVNKSQIMNAINISPRTTGSSVLDIESLDPTFIPYVLFRSSPNSPINMKLELKNLTFEGFSSLRVVSIE